MGVRNRAGVLRHVVGLTTLLLALSSRVGTAEARKERHIFQLDKLELPKNAPKELEPLLQEQLAAAIAAHELLDAELPAGAPDAASDPKAFKKYLKKHKLRAFKVTVQVTSFQRSQEPDLRKGGHLVGTSITLRMFGETIPDRVMAFTGDGAANVRIEVGKKVRDRDKQAADHDAVELAIADAISTSVETLQAKRPGTRKK